MRSIPSIATTAPGLRRPSRPVDSVAFDWLVAVLSLWMAIGLFSDGFVHNHVPGLDTFFTPSHALLYSGYLATFAAIVVQTIRNHARGYAWREAIPVGYEASVLGGIIFAVGGLGDLAWHEIFGIEASVEALLSPTHLILATGGALLVLGPFRAAWRRSRGSASRWPMLLSATFLLSLLTFFTMVLNPIGRPIPAVGNQPIQSVIAVLSANPHLPVESASGLSAADTLTEVGYGSVLVFSALLMGLTLLVVRRFGARLPFGAFALVFGLNAALMGYMRDELAFVPAAVLAGLAADALLHALRPGVDHPSRMRLFAFLVPVAYFAAYFATLQVLGGVWWSVHLWAGSVFIAGLVGWAESYLVVPPSFEVVGAAEGDRDITGRETEPGGLAA